MATKLTRLTHKIAIQLLLVAKSYTIFSSLSRRPVQKLLDTPSYSLPNLCDVREHLSDIELWLSTGGDCKQEGGKYTKVEYEIRGTVLVVVSTARLMA
jgi:hypothetical protein